MQNMSYCRYENTLAAFRELTEILNLTDPESLKEELSDSEFEAATQLIELSAQVTDYYGNEDMQEEFEKL